MISLYRRAENLRREDKLLRLIKREVSPSQEDFDISVREEEDILDHLDDIVVKKKISVTGNTFAFKSRKKDMIFPVLVNTFILGAVVIGILFFTYFSSIREELIISGSGELLSTEGRLIAKLKQETEVQLKEKDLEITETRKKLDEINTEYSMLQQDMESRIRSRENELNEQLNLKLEEERLKLQNEGYSTVDIEQRLQQLEMEKNLEFRQQMDNFILKAEDELKEKEDTLSEMQSEYEDILRAKQAEQTALQNEMERRQEEIVDQLGSRLIEAETAESEISEKLSSLMTQQQQQQLVIDQIDGFYRQIRSELQKTDYDEALIKLETVENYITEGAAATLPVIAERSSVELFKIDSIRKLIEKEIIETESKAETPPQEVLKLSKAALIVDEADILYGEGKTGEAAIMYLKAIEEIPELYRSHDRLMTLSSTTAEQEKKALEDKLLLSRREMADVKNKLSEADRKISNMSSEIQEQKITDAYADNLTKRIATAQKIISDSSPGNYTEYSQEELLSLLQSKVLMKEILNSEEVKAEFPDLYENLEKYFIAYGKFKLDEGKEEALGALITIINTISDSEFDLEEELSDRTFSGGLEQSLYFELLDKLKIILNNTI